MFRRLAAGAVAVVATALALSACTVEQTDWANRSYTLTASTCGTATPIAVSLHGGEARLTIGADVFDVRLAKVAIGEMTGSGANEAAILLSCTRPPTNFFGSELQIFTDGPRPLARLTPPHGLGSVNNAWNAPSISVAGHHLITGVYEWLPNDPRCCPSGRDTYQWTWNGHGFTASLYPPAYN